MQALFASVGPAIAAKMDDRTVAAYYQAHVLDGRAVIAGYLYEPLAWLTQPDPDRNQFCLCWSRKDLLVFAEGTQTLKKLGRKAKLRVRR